MIPISESQPQFGNIKRTCNKICAQPQSIENINPQNWNKSVNKWNNQKYRKPLANLSNTYTRMETECPIKLDRPLNKKLKTCSASSSSSYGNTDSMNITRRNERERNRVKLLNMGFDRLRAVVPCRSGEQLSKISTLKKAIWYIEHLDKVLHGQENSCSSSSSSQMNQSTDFTNESTTCINNKIKQTNSFISSSLPKSAGLFEINRNEARSEASWSSFEKVMSPYGNISIQERRSVNQLYLSPIFPTHWDQNINTNSHTNNFNNNNHHHNDIKEITSTPIINSTPYNMINPIGQDERPVTHLLSNTSSSFTEFSSDSGYDSSKSQLEFLSKISNHYALPTWYNVGCMPTTSVSSFSNPLVSNSSDSTSKNQSVLNNVSHLQWLLNDDNYMSKLNGT
uniref:Achaete-scute transcription factor-related n=1 Tax=Schistosoma mansoni TaxID=6183 RepID=A0A3Q0KNK5_SCHMA